MKKYEVGQKIVWKIEEPYGYSDRFDAIITEIYDDHCIAKTNDGDMTLWIDDETEYMFIS